MHVFIRHQYLYNIFFIKTIPGNIRNFGFCGVKKISWHTLCKKKKFAHVAKKSDLSIIFWPATKIKRPTGRFILFYFYPFAALAAHGTVSVCQLSLQNRTKMRRKRNYDSMKVL